MYEYLVSVGGYEQRVKFLAESREQADAKAEEWVGDSGSVIEFVGLWCINS